MKKLTEELMTVRRWDRWVVYWGVGTTVTTFHIRTIHIFRFGASNCMIGEGEYCALFYYLYLPMTTLLVINIIFFCLMIFNFTCGIWKSDFLRKRQLKNFTILVELVFLMGINWVSRVRIIYSNVKNSILLFSDSFLFY